MLTKERAVALARLYLDARGAARATIGAGVRITVSEAHSRRFEQLGLILPPSDVWSMAIIWDGSGGTVDGDEGHSVLLCIDVHTEKIELIPRP